MRVSQCHSERRTVLKQIANVMNQSKGLESASQ